MQLSLTRPTGRVRRPNLGSVPLILGTALVTAVVLADLLLGLDALRAAGLVGQEPSGGGVFQTMMHTLQQNLIWLIVVGIGLLGTAIAGLMMFGSQQAIVMFFRLGAGVAVLLIVLPAFLA